MEKVVSEADTVQLLLSHVGTRDLLTACRLVSKKWNKGVSRLLSSDCELVDASSVLSRLVLSMGPRNESLLVRMFCKYWAPKFWTAEPVKQLFSRLMVRAANATGKSRLALQLLVLEVSCQIQADFKEELIVVQTPWCLMKSFSRVGNLLSKHLESRFEMQLSWVNNSSPAFAVCKRFKQFQEDITEERIALTNAASGALAGMEEEKLDLLCLLDNMRTFCVPSELFGRTGGRKRRYTMRP